MPDSLSLLWGLVDGQLHQGTAISSSAAMLLQGARWNPSLQEYSQDLKGYQQLLAGGLHNQQHLEAATGRTDAAAIGSNDAAETGSTTLCTDATVAGSSRTAVAVQQLAVSCKHALLLLTDGRAFCCNTSDYQTAPSDTDTRQVNGMLSLQQQWYFGVRVQLEGVQNPSSAVTMPVYQHCQPPAPTHCCNAPVQVLL